MYVAHGDETWNSEDFQDKWPKHAGAWYDKYENIVQPVGSEICVY
jgi:hypothetical protein